MRQSPAAHRGRKGEPTHASHGSRGAKDHMVLLISGPSQCFKQGFFTLGLLQSPPNLLNQVLRWTNVDLQPLGQNTSTVVGNRAASLFLLGIILGPVRPSYMLDSMGLPPCSCKLGG